MQTSTANIDGLNRPIDPSEISLLLVEDEAIVAEDMRRRMEALGFVVVGIATRGTDAIEMAISLRPRLLIMDIGLRGDLDGIETFQRIREKIDIPVIFSSAHSDEVTLQRVRAAHPQGFVLKPFEERELLTNIEMALYRHASDRLLRDNDNIFRRVFETLPDGLLLEDSTRKVQIANPSFFRIFRIPVSIPLIGEDTRTGLSHYQAIVKDHIAHLRRKEELIHAGIAVADEFVSTNDGRRLSLSYTPIIGTDETTHHLWQYHEVGSSARHR